MEGSCCPGHICDGSARAQGCGEPCEATVPQARSGSQGRELPKSETSLRSFQETRIAPNKVVMPLTSLLQKHNKVILQVVTVTLEEGHLCICVSHDIKEGHHPLAPLGTCAL